MELSSDWVGFQEVFHPRPKGSTSKTALAMSSVYALVEGVEIVEILAEGEDLADWIGVPIAKFKSSFPNRQVIEIDRGVLDKAALDTLSEKTYHHQLAILRDELGMQAPRHFLIQGIEGWWSRVFPSRYGFYVHVEGVRSKDVFLLMRHGVVEGFERPDLAAFTLAGRIDPHRCVEKLAEQYRVPVQGLFVKEADWLAWAQSDDPWKDLAQAIRAKRAKLAPFRWGIAMMLATRGYLNI